MALTALFEVPFRLPSTNSPAVVALRSLVFLAGAVTVANQALHLLQFSWFYFLRPSSVRKYLHGPAPYAIVTGATDGIGKAVARELFGRGFNLIIHGRNEEKIRTVIAEIKASGGNGDIRYFVADAKAGGHDFAQLLAPFADLHITLVIHNVGGALMRGERIDGFSEAELLETIFWNDVFPLLLTRALLPQLRATAQRGPVLAQFVGSQAALASPVTMTTYAATKGFLATLSRGLDNDEQLWGTPTGVRFEYLSVGNVSTPGNPQDVSLMTPSAAAFAKALVDKIGCGKRFYTPSRPHAILGSAAAVLPERTVDAIAAQMIEKAHEAQRKRH
ncbi:NAD-binding protein [Fomitopsis schrenkii]|uniref:NAD-binding protein n=1 Tax=Fomitopsis schrenkii TaxID=2126942 RepID=S8DLA8_FOMSC|nr:NAD-binding protein [Fomitopsis schrenkii]